MNVDRAPKSHLAFGAGAHHCLGAQLARMELRHVRRHRAGALPVRRREALRSGRRVIEPDDAARDAAASCPVEAISLADAGTGDPVPLDD